MQVRLQEVLAGLPTRLLLVHGSTNPRIEPARRDQTGGSASGSLRLVIRAVTLDFWNTLFVDRRGREREHMRADILRAELVARLQKSGGKSVLEQVDVEGLTAILASKAPPPSDV